MDALPAKWDPRGEHPEDYEEAQMSERLTEEIKNARIFDRTVTTRGTLASIFRIFTSTEPTCNERLNMKLAEGDVCELIIATDGSCIKTGSGMHKPEQGYMWTRVIHLTEVCGSPYP